MMFVDRMMVMITGGSSEEYEGGGDEGPEYDEE